MLALAPGTFLPQAPAGLEAEGGDAANILGLVKGLANVLLT